MKTYTLSWNSGTLTLGKKTCIMGILNITPDSFSDGGLFFNTEQAISQGLKMAEHGADIIDIGGESSRPFSEVVSAEEEMSRVLPVIESLVKKISVPISIDTTKALVAKRAIDSGASIINDVSALRYDPEMANVAAEYGLPVILMHMKGTPKTMQVNPEYDDVVKDIKEFLAHAVANAEKKGISREKIIIDPGIGFGKTIEHNLELIRRLSEFQSLDLPILIGTSRKAFIRKILGNNREINPREKIVEIGTQASIAAAILSGASIVRVHDVETTYSTVKIIDSICRGL